MPVVQHLRWIDVDPARHPFDPSLAEAIVEARLPAELSRGPEHDKRRQLVEDAIHRALLAAYGPWIGGWRFSAEGGGFVNSYCCAVHSLGGSRAQTAERIVGAVREWRYRLERLAGELEETRRETEGKPAEEAVSWAAARLLPLVLEWTQASDAWYASYELVLAWYLEPDVDPSRARVLVREAIGGRFHSWIEPTDELRGAVTASIAESVEREQREGPPVVDALDAWMQQRRLIEWGRERLYAPDPVRRDGHRAYIETADAARDPIRAARMLRALEACRASARRGERLSFESLRAWQRLVLDAEVDFRTAEAFAHRGSERYGLGPETRWQLEACLAEANDAASVTAVARAARAYLDVCYFHPFPDGNARAARLALDHVLTRAGLALHAAEPVFIVARRALDRFGAYSFQSIVDYLAGAASA